MFADTDFLLALIKESDWLKKNAVQILEEHKGKIRTSVSVMIEIALLCKKFRINTIKVFTNIFELIEVSQETYSVCMQASVYIEKYNLNVFDAFHAAFCGNDKIISSDSIFDNIGLDRFNLNKNP
ncbi:PIN domain-containing protein [Candidatus Woesearchaeota archaeon]|nr:PIN domain-containing protein [Candidatus Woesearchaeota archaeon]